MFFDKFNETIIAKSSNELERKVEFLKELKNKYPDDERINRDLKIAEFGLKGEKEIEFELKNANIGMYVLHDINLKYEDLTAQIDFVVITRAAIYFIECKNLFGSITVDSYGNFTREYKYEEKRVKEGFYSPYTQAKRHKEIMRKIWYASHNKVLTTILSKSFDEWYRELVVISNPKSVLNISKAPKEIRNKIIKSDSLERYLKEDINKANKAYLSNKKEMYDSAVNMLSMHKEIKRDYEKEYQEYLKRDKEQVKRNLLEFRRNRAKEKNIPENYVFSDAELEKILEQMPKTIEELENSLFKIKVICHGKEIIDIINNKAFMDTNR
ncbi:MAG: NERD domain-containing protein [Clostridia bacterium]|nr:NERD domain-containing protein [Clostridia bacterium]